MSSSWQQGKLKEFCKQKGIHLAAWSPLGSYTKSWGTNSVMESPIINEIATSRHKSVPQHRFFIEFTCKAYKPEKFEIFSSKVTDIGICFLKGLQNLALLNLEGCFVTAVCLDTLAG
ncbi:hypothetical protein AHAS_Ahas09G0154900 [Arachis hypogaea]